MTCLAEELETPGPGQVKAVITVAGNPVLSAPNGPRIARALAGCELVISVDIYLNETTRHADVILPGLSPLEDSHYDVAFPQLAFRNTARYSPPVRPRGDRPAEWEILLRLQAIAMGRGARVDLRAYDDELAAEDVRRVVGPAAELVLAAVAPQIGPERLLDLGLRAGPYKLTLAQVAARPGGIDLGPLAPRVPEVLRTPSGKIELAPAVLIADLARVRADLERPVPDLVVIGRRQLRSNNSWMHNLPTLAAGKFRCTALVHPSDAARLGLVDGEPAQIVRDDHAIVVDVELTDAMMPGVVSVPHGWGHDEAGTQLGVAAARPGANLNAILDDARRDPLSGNAVLGGVPVVMRPYLRI
jgi:anaerobic selenocysteine-containing dehydrogenase